MYQFLRVYWFVPKLRLFGNALSCKASALQESNGKSRYRKLNFFSIKLKNIIDNINYVCYYISVVFKITMSIYVSFV